MSGTFFSQLFAPSPLQGPDYNYAKGHEEFLEKIKNPTIFGPGYWACIHIICHQKSNTPEESLQTIPYLLVLINAVPCVDPCRVHIQAYWQRDHPSNYVYRKRGLFEWSVNAHNYRNQALGKLIISVQEADVFWSKVINPDPAIKPCKNCHDNFKVTVAPMTGKQVRPW